MAFTNYKYDLFVSYAHKERDWVVEFVRRLVSEVNMRCARDIEFYISKPRKTFLTEQEIEQIVFGSLDNSAVLLLIISSYYIDRQWFNKEVQEFSMMAEKKGGLITNNSSRIFMVNATNVPADRLPPELQKIMWFDIGAGSAQQNALLEKPDGDKYYDYFSKLPQLANSIHRKLDELRSA